MLAIASSQVDEANHVIFLIQYQLASNFFQSIDYIYIYMYISYYRFVFAYYTCKELSCVNKS